MGARVRLPGTFGRWTAFPSGLSAAKVPPAMSTTDGGISDRKADHIELCATGDVGFHRKTTMFEHVDLIHDALPELALDEIDTSITILGKKLRVPLVISAMTGGTARAREINRELRPSPRRAGTASGSAASGPCCAATATTRTRSGTWRRRR